MLLSVIVPTCNRNDLLKLCLDRLSKNFQTIGEDYEILVTDDSLQNIAKGLAEEHGNAKWISGPQKGPAANRNNGAKNAKGDWLIFIDDDCLPEKDLLLNYRIAISKNPGQEAFEGAIVPDDWNLLKKDLSECPVNVLGDSFWSANVCIKASLFKQVKGFDENYKIAAQEDQQMKLDIESFTGKKIQFVRECAVVHPVRFSTLRKQINKVHRVSENFLIYAVKNRQKLGYNTPFSFGLSQFKLHLRNTIQTIKGGKVKASVIALVWLFYGVPLNIVNYYKIRGRYQNSNT